MKKILISMLLVTFLFPSYVNASTNNGEYVNNNGITMSTEQIERLKNMGFTDSNIAVMTPEEFNKNKDLEGTIVSQDTRYVETIYYTLPGGVSTFGISDNNNVLIVNRDLTEEEYNSYNTSPTISTYGSPVSYETSAKKITTTIIKNGNYYRLKNDLVWKTMPITRSYDVFGMLQDSTVSGVPESRSASVSYKKRNQCTGVETGWVSDTAYTASLNAGNWKMGPSGYGVTMALPKNNACAMGNSNGTVTYKDNEVFALQATMYYDVQKIQTTTIQTVNAYGSYQHSVSSVTIAVSLDFGISSAGLGGVLNFSASAKPKFDGMGGTHAYLSGLSW